MNSAKEQDTQQLLQICYADNRQQEAYMKVGFQTYWSPADGVVKQKMLSLLMCYSFLHFWVLNTGSHFHDCMLSYNKYVFYPSTSRTTYYMQTCPCA